MPWYSTGSVAVSAGSATVTGTGTAFSANGRVGDAFRGPDGLWYEVTNIVSATVLSIKPNYQGATAAGQAYAIAPMQGYVKESADRLRQFVDQYGATLGSIADWATAADAVAALTALGFSTSGKAVATGTPEQGRQALGALSTTGTAADSVKLGGTDAVQFYRRANILGTVSQSGGVPTGAIIERGSNANGEYTRLADGRQICARMGSAQMGMSGQVGSTYQSGGQDFSFPALFVAAPVVVPTTAYSLNALTWGSISGNPSSASCSIVALSASSSASTRLGYVAIGFWY